jgi:Arc/MetJ family transcription regulator
VRGAGRSIIMKATITIDKTILDRLLRESGLKNKTTAMREAVAVYLMQRKRAKVKSMKGKLKFDMTAEQLRHCGNG